MVYKIIKCEKITGAVVCQHCEIIQDIVYDIIIEDLYYTRSFCLCYDCFNWLHEKFNIEE